MFRGGALGKLKNHEGSDLISVFTDKFINWWHYWEVVESRRQGIIGEHRSLGACIQRVYLVPAPYPFLFLYFLCAMRWTTFLHHMPPAVMSDTPPMVPEATELSGHGLKPLKLWAKINP
jgi:hypothetical protein